MIKIKIFSDFCSSNTAINNYNNVYNIDKHCLYGKKIIFTVEEDYTHAIILNTAMPSLKINKNNVIGFAFEPLFYLKLTNEFILYAQKYIGKYYIGQKNDLPMPFFEHFSFMWFTPIPMSIKQKTKFMSIVFSEKQQTFGHRYRYKLIDKIVNNNLPIDIYGRGCKSLNKIDPRVRDSFIGIEPYEDYMFTIVIENCQYNDYFSEKILDALMYETTAIYYGAKNIDKYFGDVCVILSGDIERDMIIIEQIIDNPIKYRKKINAKQIHDKLNFIDHLLKIIQ